MQLISFGYGRETFSNCGVSVTTFIVKAPFSREFPTNLFKRQGQAQRFPASLHPEVNGYMHLDTVVNVPDGTIVLIQSKHTRNSLPLKDGAIFISLRATGPMLSIMASLPSAQEATLTGQQLVFQGRGDILSADDLSEYGLRVSNSYVEAYMEEDEVAECLTVNVTGAAISDKPTFEMAKNRDGDTIALKKRPGRKLSLRRNA